jgi:spermidine synthase
MDWFTEKWAPDVNFSIQITEHIHQEKTPYQNIAFYNSKTFGKFFTLDGIMMANEKDEFIYHEMMIHTPLSINPQIERVLVIGGGDGGSARELTKYETIKKIDMVEIDERVVRLCQIYLPQTASKLVDPRVSLYFEDGLTYVANEKDEFIYHEMIVHTPMSIHPEVNHVLVIGGGDGGSVRELVRYKTIESIDMVEIDEAVVRGCQKFFPITTTGLNDPRVTLLFQDGLRFVKDTTKKYDLIIVDSTDPIGPGEGLFSMDFYQNCYRILKDDGILINQHESPYFEKEATEMKRAHNKIKSLFDIASVYQAFIPTYPSGHWLFGFASKKYHPLADFQGALTEKLNINTKYYNTELHKGSFALPNYVIEQLKTV